MIATATAAFAQMVREGKFRADLYYRLNVIPLSLPPLRERAGDIRELAEHFARLYAAPGKVLQFAPEFLELLEKHSWPGNVRELADCMRRVAALSAGTTVSVDKLEGLEWWRWKVKRKRTHVSARGFLSERWKKAGGNHAASDGGNRSRAAELLEVSLVQSEIK